MIIASLMLAVALRPARHIQETQIKQPRIGWTLRQYNGVTVKWRDERDGRVYVCTEAGRFCQYTGNRKIYQWQLGF